MPKFFAKRCQVCSAVRRVRKTTWKVRVRVMKETGQKNLVLICTFCTGAGIMTQGAKLAAFVGARMLKPEKQLLGEQVAPPA